MVKQTLTVPKIESLRPVYPKGHARAGQKLAKGDRYAVMDSQVPGFGVRVSDSGLRTFVLRTRYPGGEHASWRALGEYPVITLADARAKAGRWRTLVKQGTDPALVEERERAEALQRQENTFAAVAEDFIADKLSRERKGREVERDIRREFLPVWDRRPITDITDVDVLSVINAKKRTAPAQARNLLGVAKRMFAWAVDQRVYGLKASPAADLKPTKIIGEKIIRDRVLNDREIFALWRAAKRTPYPYGSVYRLLVLTALRLNEAADAAWAEFDLANRIWKIPASRMKGKNGKARAHVVPLTDDILALIEALPRFKKGKHLFSTTFGESPAWMSDKVKKRIDARMLRTLRALAHTSDEDAATVELEPWTNHDIRRTVRSNLSRLRVTEEAREALLAHARPGIKGVYDHHDYLDEKREALEQWSARLKSIVEPASDNVVTLAKARA